MGFFQNPSKMKFHISQNDSIFAGFWKQWRWPWTEHNRACSTTIDVAFQSLLCLLCTSFFTIVLAPLCDWLPHFYYYPRVFQMALQCYFKQNCVDIRFEITDKIGNTQLIIQSGNWVDCTFLLCHIWWNCFVCVRFYTKVRINSGINADH